MRAHYLRFFYWQVWRYATRHRLLALLNILSVALGVAVYLAIQVANQSANRAFAATIDIVAGKADLQVTRASGGLPDEIFPAVARQPGIAAATPLLRGIVSLPELPGEYLQILGVDVFTNHAFRTFDLNDFAAGEFDLPKWLASPATVAVTEAFARRHNLKSGDALRAQVDGVDHALRVGFIIRARGALALDEHFAAMDLGWAQEFFARRGSLSAIQVRLTDARQSENAASALRAALPPDVTVETPATRGQQVTNMLGGFQLNLTAMSLVSLLVGMFLIYNTVSAAVVRRRHEIGILRSLGVTRHEVRALFLAEALLLGGIGALLGLGGGILLARLLVGKVAETISSLYVLLRVQELALAPSLLLGAFVLGLVSVVLAAWLPAAAAARMDPVRALHASSLIEQSARLSPAWMLAGGAALLAAALFSWLALATGPPWLGFGAAFCVLLGFSFLVPRVALLFSAVARRFFRIGQRGPLEANLAAANVARPLFRNAITIAALAAAVAMAIGVDVMVFSFRRTVEGWIEQTLAADLFVAPATNEVVGVASFIPPAALRFFAQHPSVAEVDTYREIQVPLGDKTIALAVVRGTERRRFPLLRGDPGRALERFHKENGVLLSESFARRHGVSEGEALALTTPGGVQAFPVAGIFYDYTRDQGVVFLSTATFARFWPGDERVNSLAIYLRPGASAPDLSAKFRAEFSQRGQFMILSNGELRARVFEIFDQTFAVTYVLRTIAIVVAMVGICLTLTTLITERARELALMRAIGASVTQVWKLLLWESGMLGFLAALVGLASGLALSVVLTGVINRAFFGWTIQLAFPWSALALTPVGIVGVAVLAGTWPAWRAGRLIVAEALREE